MNPTEKIISLKAGETVTLKAEGEISEVKQPKRNSKKEREWERQKYHRFTFLVDREKGERFIEILESRSMKPLEWFREQIENTLKAEKEAKTDTLNVETTPVAEPEGETKPKRKTRSKTSSKTTLKE